MSQRTLPFVIPFLASVVLAACTSVQPETAGPAPVAGGQCNAEPVQWALGKTADQDTMAKVWRGSGAGLIRPIAPNQAVTLEYKADRINVHVDASNVITRITCG